MSSRAETFRELPRQDAAPENAANRLKIEAEQLRQQLREKEQRILQLEAKSPKRRSN